MLRVRNKTYEEKAKPLRKKRNKAISNTDYLIMPDYPLLNREEWVQYRQALRDVHQQEGFPDKIVWPKRPPIKLAENQDV